MKITIKRWFHGLFGGVIGGAATAGTSWLAMAGAKSAGMDVPELNWKALGVILVSGAVTSALAYLKQSPLPPVNGDTTHIRKSTLPMLLIGALCLAPLTGCKTTEPPTREARIAYTFQDTWTLARVAYDAFAERVVLGKVSRADEARVDAAWNHFRAAFAVAFRAASQNWNTATTAKIDALRDDLLDLIRRF